MPMTSIRFFDFSAEIEELGDELTAAIRRVIDSGRFILGEQVEAFENEFAAFCGAKHALGVASGTDALFLTLKAAGIGAGDEVITVSNTFAATALAISYTGAKTVFVDIEKDGHLIDPALIEQAVTSRTKAVIPVHLYGQCADMDAINNIAQKHGLFVLEDACQAHGALYKTRPAGSLGNAAAFSFYPTKNLGAYGDGGMITTGDSKLYEKLKLLRQYGQTNRYHYVLKGYNSRLDEMQAAILRVKLKHLTAWNNKRNAIAAIYDSSLSEINQIKVRLTPGSTHAYHLYVISIDDRDALCSGLKEKGIETLIHYPTPLHEQEAFADAVIAGDLSNTSKRCSSILSLPIYPGMPHNDARTVCEAIKSLI
jgi:dTDP-4-amino-4,6-dideoxygalactose transaminase